MWELCILVVRKEQSPTLIDVFNFAAYDSLCMMSFETTGGWCKVFNPWYDSNVGLRASVKSVESYMIINSNRITLHSTRQHIWCWRPPTSPIHKFSRLLVRTLKVCTWPHSWIWPSQWEYHAKKLSWYTLLKYSSQGIVQPFFENFDSKMVPSRLYNYCSSILESPVLYLCREFLEIFLLSAFLVNPRWLWILPLGPDLLSYISEACRRFREGAWTSYLSIQKKIGPGFSIPLAVKFTLPISLQGPPKNGTEGERDRGWDPIQIRTDTGSPSSPLSAGSKA